MIERIIDFSSRNKFVVIVAAAVAVVAAVWALYRVPLDAIPASSLSARSA